MKSPSDSPAEKRPVSPGATPGIYPAPKAGLSLLPAVIHLKRAISPLPLMAMLILAIAIILYIFLVKPILDMDFDISPANTELAQIYEELWE